MSVENNIPPIVIASPGRLGDLVTAEAIFRQAHEAEPERPVVFYTKPEFSAVMEYCPYISKIMTVSNKTDFDDLESKFPEGTKFLRVNLGGPPMPPVPREEIDQTYNLLNQFQNENGLPLKNDFSRFYLKSQDRPEGLPERYIVFHCSSNGKSRQWPLKNWKKLAEFCIRNKMPVVEIGFGSVVNLDHPDYLSRCDNPDLQDTAAVIKYAQAVVGIESGMLHIANALGVFGFIITGALHKMDEYNHYCGSYYEKKNCNFLRYFGKSPFELPYPPVEKAIGEFLKGKPLTADECERMFFHIQLKEEQQKFFNRLWSKVRNIFLRWQQAHQFHQRPRRKK